MLKQLLQRKFTGLFHSVTLNGNLFASVPVLCAGVLLSCTGNHFASDKPQEGLYGLMIARSAVASANIGELFGDNATLAFLTVKGQFRGAANMVFTMPQSTP